MECGSAAWLCGKPVAFRLLPSNLPRGYASRMARLSLAGDKVIANGKAEPFRTTGGRAA
jgi:hypothetical protein